MCVIDHWMLCDLINGTLRVCYISIACLCEVNWYSGYLFI